MNNFWLKITIDDGYFWILDVTTPSKQVHEKYSDFLELKERVNELLKEYKEDL